MSEPEQVYLIEVGEDTVWSEEPVAEESDAVKYIREDLVNRDIKSSVCELEAALIGFAAELALEVQSEKTTEQQDKYLQDLIHRIMDKVLC